jgi:hypothetical protein
MTEFLCQSIDFAGTTWCGRCRLNWTTGARDAPKCKPKADPPIGVPTMYTELVAEAGRITDSQHAAILAQMRTEPYAPEMRRVAVLMAAAELLALIYRDKQIMELLKATGGK